MVGGAIIVGLCLLVLGWTKEIVGLFITDGSTVCSGEAAVFVAYVDPLQKKNATIALAVLSIYAVDFAINAGI